MRVKFNVFFKTIFFVFMFIYCFIWAFSPLIARYYLNNYTLPKSLFLMSSSAIRYNPFTSHLSIGELILGEGGTDAEQVFKIEQLDIELNLYQLFFDKIYFSEFKIDGVYLQVNIDDQVLEVAGIDVNNNQASATQTNEQQTPFPYEIIIPEIIINNTHVDLQHFKQTHEIALQSLHVDNTSISLAQQSLSLSLKSTINNAPLTIAVDTALHQQLGEVNIAIALERLALDNFQQFLPKDIAGLTGEVSYSANHLLTLSENRTQAVISGLKLAINAMAVKQGNVAISIEKQLVHSNMLTLDIKPSQALTINGGLNFRSKQLTATTIDTKELLAEIDALVIPELKFSLSENLASAEIENIMIKHAIFSQRGNKEIPALAAFTALSINDIRVTQQALNIADMNLSGLKVDVSLDQQQALENLVLLNSHSGNGAVNDSKMTAAETTADSEIRVIESAKERKVSEQNTSVTAHKNTADEVTEFAFSLGHFQLQNEAQLNLQDKSVTPNYQRTFRLTTLEITDVDTQDSELISKVKLSGKSNQYAHFDFTASGQPFIDEKQFSLNGALKEVSLPAVSSYIKDALAHEIISGQVDLDIDAKLAGTMIDGNIDVVLRGIEFSSADDHETNALNDRTTIPFNVALDMLKDSAGNVELSVPLSGDTSSPSFGASGFLTLLIKQATMAAAKEYLITTFIPYASVVKVALIAGEYALKLRVNDFIYQSKQTEFSLKQNEFMRQFSELLADKPEVNIKLCPFATVSDLPSENGLALSLPENIARLKDISQTRISEFKAYMVNQLKVESSRLLLCTPQIDREPSAKSRIEFVI